MDLAPNFQPPALQCTATSYFGKTDPWGRYGMGGYHRCTKPHGHKGQHKDGFGNRFRGNR